MFSVSRPSEVLVLNCWVTATKLTLCFSKMLKHAGEVQQRSAQTVDFIHDDAIQFARFGCLKQPPQSRPVHVRAGEPAVVIQLRQREPSFAPLALNEGLGAKDR
jgi:hypothetical protein